MMGDNKSEKFFKVLNERMKEAQQDIKATVSVNVGEMSNKANEGGAETGEEAGAITSTREVWWGYGGWAHGSERTLVHELVVGSVSRGLTYPEHRALHRPSGGPRPGGPGTEGARDRDGPGCVDHEAHPPLPTAAL